MAACSAKEIHHEGWEHLAVVGLTAQNMAGNIDSLSLLTIQQPSMSQIMNSKKHLYRQLRCSDKKRSKGKWTPLRSLNRTNKCQDKSDKIHKESPNQQAKRDKQQETMHRVWRRRSRHGNRYEGDIDNKHQNGHDKRSESHTNKRTIPTSISRRIEQWQAGYPEQTPPFPQSHPTAARHPPGVSPAGSR